MTTEQRSAAPSRTTPKTPRRSHHHHEEHASSGEAVRDIIIGMSDGLTVPFALAAGITGAVAASHLVVTAGIAELAAGGISMGLGGYLAARSDLEHYASERKREYDETHELPDEERREIVGIFRSYGLEGDALDQVVDRITSDRHRWVDFMMKFELGLDQPNPRAAPLSAARIGGSYVVGGIIPLLPYVILPSATTALFWSCGLTAIALFVFGAVKGRFTGVNVTKSALQTLMIGGVAAAVAFLLARLVA